MLGLGRWQVANWKRRRSISNRQEGPFGTGHCSKRQGDICAKYHSGCDAPEKHLGAFTHSAGFVRFKNPAANSRIGFVCCADRLKKVKKCHMQFEGLFSHEFQAQKTHQSADKLEHFALDPRERKQRSSWPNSSCTQLSWSAAQVCFATYSKCWVHNRDHLRTLNTSPICQSRLPWARKNKTEQDRN